MTWFARHCRTRGFTILEALVAMVILVLVIGPVLTSFSGLRTGLVKMDEHAMALAIASSVVEHIDFSLYNGDTRLSDLIDSGTAGDTGADPSEIFDKFIVHQAPVTGATSDSLSMYFVSFNDLTKSGVFGITPDNDPDLYAKLKDYRCSVDVFYSLPYDLLDSDLDGTPEVDMAEIRVKVDWTDDGNERSVELWTVISSRQYDD